MLDALSESSRSIVRYVGIALIFVGFVLLIPMAVLLVWPQEYHLAPYYAIPSVLVAIAGYLIYFYSGQQAARVLNRREAGSVIVLVWICAILVNAIPLALTDTLDGVKALFEATSGLTTTGFTVVDVDSCPKMILLHRSLMHYLGGVGLILFMTCVISDSRGLGLYNAENHADRLLAGSVRSARAILVLYTGIIAVGAIAYVIEGMPLFDAVNISISAVSTGGFAVRGDSLASYDSLAIELTTVVLMMAGASNFLLNFMLLQGRFRAVLKHVETLAFFGIVAVATLIVGVLVLSESQSMGLLQSLRVSLFHVVSIMTSTGLQTVDSEFFFAPSILFVFIILMFVGGEAGSTAGGIKVYRVVVHLKSILWHARDRIDHSRRIHRNEVNRFGKRMECGLSERLSISSFIGIYFLLYGLCIFAFVLCGASLDAAFFDAASCLGNTGFGVGFVGPDSSSPVLIVACVAMLFGRLEILPIMFGFIWMAQGIKRSTRNHVGKR